MSDLSWDATSNSSPKFSQGPRYVQYSDPCARLSTFKTWPTSIQLKPEKLAEAGFFYTGNNDIVRCFHCDLGLKNWKSDDIPFIEHARHSKKCRFVKDKKELYLIATVQDDVGRIQLDKEQEANDNEEHNEEKTRPQIRSRVLLKILLSKAKEILAWLRAFGLFDDSKESVMRNIVKSWLSVKHNKEEKCDMCSNQGIAVGYCPDCLDPGFIDQLCMTYHEKIKKLANHRVTDFRKDGYNYNIEKMVPLNVCTVHKNLKLDYYCANCRVNICPSCVEKHTKKNHGVDYVKDVLLVLSSMHDTRSFIQKTVSNLPISNSGERTLLQRLIFSIDLTFGIDSGLETIAEIETPSENESTESIVKIKGSALLEEIRKIQNDLHTLYPEDETIPKVPNNDVENEEDQHLALSRNGTFRACQKGPESIPNEHMENMMENMSFQTTDLFPSFHQAPESEQDGKTPEQEIKALQKELDNQINLDSYQDLHPYL